MTDNTEIFDTPTSAFVDAVMAEIRTMKEAIEKERDEHLRLHEDIAERTKRAETAEAQVAALQAEKAQLESKVSFLAAERDAAKDEITDLMARYDDACGDTTDVMNLREKDLVRLVELEEENSRLQTLLNEHVAKEDQLIFERTKAREEKRAATAKLAKAKGSKRWSSTERKSTTTKVPETQASKKKGSAKRTTRATAKAKTR